MPSSNTDLRSESENSSSRLSLLLAFLLPTAIMLGILAGKEIFPFGDNSFLRTDMYHQYAPFFAEFARILKEGKSLTYTFEIGLGTNFAALYAYYLASPFNWLVFLVPAQYIIEFMTYSIVFKIGLCGLTMAYYLKKHFHTNSMAITFFGICYAMCGYIAAYSWNIMWMDSLWLAPLILLGAEQLIHEGRPVLYTISLALGILCNYYLAIMLCIFMVLYFFVQIVQVKDLNLRLFLRRGILYAICSLLAGGIAAVLLMPAALALANTASADSTFPKTLTSYFGILEMLARHMMTVDVEIGLDHWPNIYCGVICLFLLPVYLISPKVSARQKISHMILLVIMLLSFSLNIPNYIWHGMHYPNSLPCRQSFLYIIVLLAMCYEALRSLPEISRSRLMTCFFGASAFVLILQVLLKDSSDIDWYAYYLTLLFLALYVFMTWLWKIGRIQALTAICLSIVLLTAETGINMAVTSVTTTSRTEYWRNAENYQILLESAEAQDTSGFYRVEKSSRRTKNDAAFVGYRSASIFSSATEAGITDFYRIFGMEASTNAYAFTGATPLMESLLSVRYRISSTEMTTSQLMEFMEWEDTAFLYRNIYTLPLGFMMPDDLSDYLFSYSGDPADAQNALVSLTTGTGDVLEEVYGDEMGDTFTWSPVNEGRYFAYISNTGVKKVTVDIGGSSKSYDNVDRGYLVDLGTCYIGSDVTITSDDGSSPRVVLYRFNEENFIRWYEQMNQQALTVTNVTNDRNSTSIDGTITVQENGTLFLSIPYEQGWTVIVDDQEVSTMDFAGAFLSVSVEEGTHEIHMEYHTPGLRLGALTSIISTLVAALFLAAVTIARRHRRRPSLSEPTDSPEAIANAETMSESNMSEDDVPEYDTSENDVPENDASENDMSKNDMSEALYSEDPTTAFERIEDQANMTDSEVLLEDEEYLSEPESENM